jgi:hypothetical protein
MTIKFISALDSSSTVNMRNALLTLSLANATLLLRGFSPKLAWGFLRIFSIHISLVSPGGNCIEMGWGPMAGWGGGGGYALFCVKMSLKRRIQALLGRVAKSKPTTYVYLRSRIITIGK